MQHMEEYWADTHIKKQASRYDWAVGNGDQWSEIAYVEEQKCVMEWLEQPRQNKNILYSHTKPKEATK